jgi:hypothetical protein
MTRAYSRGGNGDPYYYGHPLRAFGLVRHCAQCGAEFVIRAEHHFFCTLPYLIATKLVFNRPANVYVGLGPASPMAMP